MTSLFEHRINLLRPIVGTEKGESGPYLRYEPVYDHIRFARMEENPRLSQGVWIKEFKRADFSSMEKLCLDALTTQTKDLQIFAWLLESWLGLYGILGLSQGLNIFKEFLETFWGSCHPTDHDHRSLFFQWLDESIATRLYTIPLTSTRDNARDYHFQDYSNAVLLEQVSKRDASSKKMIDAAKKRGEVTLEQFMQDLFQTEMNLLISHEQGLHHVKNTLQEIKHFLDQQLGKDAPSFSKIFSVSMEMTRLLHDTINIQHQQAEKRRAQSQPSAQSLTSSMPLSETATLLLPEEYTPHPDAVRLSQSNEHLTPQKTTTIATDIPARDAVAPASEPLPSTLHHPVINRSEAYTQLRMLADIFAILEPQSPTTSLLSVLSTWEHRSFQDILSDFMGKDAVSVFLSEKKQPMGNILLKDTSPPSKKS